jgi:hypothetical protein
MAPLPFLFLIAAQAAAPQADWRPLGTSPGGRVTTYDAASVARTGAVTRVRMRFQEGGPYAISVVELRCAAYEARAMGSVTYDANGVELARNEMTSPFRAIIAGTILETLRAELCGTGEARPAQ